MSKRWLKKLNLETLGVFVAFLGLLKVIGAVTGIGFFTALGQTLAIAPAPNPFLHVGTSDPENFSEGVVFGCEDSSGRTAWHKWGYHVRVEIPGPHRRSVTLINWINLHSRVGEPLERERFEKLTRYYLCDGGPLAQAISCEPHPRAILFRDAKSVVRVECSG